ncbi:uncharacterized protein B0H18DRAFT_1031079 [Fomitopsis serialis]|uniref:uncharacterized protein n=1 Tax=Fomitopsis serialis TaxID=139415 RepID=UPI0020078BEF|nr:uncharacterized protein B0H18DRAFT_1031079 [Neoantrodia serialis]KAH9918502.1 hypothetical protein B0H18DRAFT_1031079 [Neoantrodia serialis]
MPALAITIDYFGLKAEYMKIHREQAGDFLETILAEDLTTLDFSPPREVWLVNWEHARVMCYWKSKGDDGLRAIKHLRARTQAVRKDPALLQALNIARLQVVLHASLPASRVPRTPDADATASKSAGPLVRGLSTANPGRPTDVQAARNKALADKTSTLNVPAPGTGSLNMMAGRPVKVEVDAATAFHGISAELGHTEADSVDAGSIRRAFQPTTQSPVPVKTEQMEEEVVLQQFTGTLAGYNSTQPEHAIHKVEPSHRGELEDTAEANLQREIRKSELGELQLVKDCTHWLRGINDTRDRLRCFREENSRFRAIHASNIADETRMLHSIRAVERDLGLLRR